MSDILGRIGAPIDPAYAPFVEGVKRVAADPPANSTYYWHPATSTWYPYPHADWILEDLALAPTTDSSAIEGPELKERDGKLVAVVSVTESALGPLFTKVREANAAAHATHPKANLIWHPIGGRWRNAIKRKAAGGGGWDLPAEALKRLDEVDEHVRAGIIDHETGERRKLEIISEYEPRRP